MISLKATHQPKWITTLKTAKIFLLMLIKCRVDFSSMLFMMIVGIKMTFSHQATKHIKTVDGTAHHKRISLKNFMVIMAQTDVGKTV